MHMRVTFKAYLAETSQSGPGYMTLSTVLFYEFICCSLWAFILDYFLFIYGLLVYFFIK